jgi:hypothetical protein
MMSRYERLLAPMRGRGPLPGLGAAAADSLFWRE